MRIVSVSKEQIFEGLALLTALDLAGIDLYDDISIDEALEEDANTVSDYDFDRIYKEVTEAYDMSGPEWDD